MTEEPNREPSPAIQSTQGSPGTTPIPPDLRLADAVRIKFRCDCGQRIRISARPGQKDHECPRCWERHKSPLPGDPRIREIFCPCENPVDLPNPLCSQCQAPVLVPIHHPVESSAELPLDSDSPPDPKVLPYATFLDSPAPTFDEGAPTVLRPADEPPKPAPAETKSRSRQSSPSHPSRVRRSHSSDQRRSLQKRPLFARTEVQLITVGLLFALVFFTWFTKVYVKKFERSDRHSETPE
ncbi:MAG: hypothetical protein QF752_02735 [Planctomycetota bacterium]|nr:hypothetical protein [Planctomycetota bacterium]